MKNYLETPIYKKSEEIFETLKTITDLFPEDDPILSDLKGQLLVSQSLHLVVIKCRLTAVC